MMLKGFIEESKPEKIHCWVYNNNSGEIETERDYRDLTREDF